MLMPIKIGPRGVGLGGGQVGGGQSGCERRSEVIVKLKKMRGGVGGQVWGGVRLDVNEGVYWFIRRCFPSYACKSCSLSSAEYAFNERVAREGIM